jgi:hypothetical protein
LAGWLNGMAASSRQWRSKEILSRMVAPYLGRRPARSSSRRRCTSHGAVAIKNECTGRVHRQSLCLGDLRPPPPKSPEFFNVKIAFCVLTIFRGRQTNDRQAKAAKAHGTGPWRPKQNRKPRMAKDPWPCLSVKLRPLPLYCLPVLPALEGNRHHAEKCTVIAASGE